ncbi:hypothetical protein ABEB36_010090 [Hypothenemus hampei]|uniref:Regulator of microtubule dynamics protein 1 n=1 Tax=Hypothenemus hampei TaxID=57062 RepID=A0ABD1EIL9_HYPHA
MHLKQATKPLLSISIIQLIKEKYFLEKEDKIAKYWDNNQSRLDIIQRADKLFEQQKYMDVYETLNRIKFSNDIEIVWRLARALYNLSQNPEISDEVRMEMIVEAHKILVKASGIGTGKSNYHKWLAVILNTKHGLQSLETKIREYENVKEQLIKACESNPRDFTVQYMLGRWHYEMANLTWLQRRIAKYFYLEPPISTYQEAYKHLIKAEELQPRCFIPNLYVLGSACMKIGQYYRAKYYLNLALSLPVHTECEKCCVTGARNLLRKLEKYDLSKDLFNENYNFGFDN